MRIGYVSSFFHRDNWMKPVWGLINQHDRSKVQVHLFADSARDAIVHGYREHPQDRYHDTRRLDQASLQQLIAGKRRAGVDRPQRIQQPNTPADVPTQARASDYRLVQHVRDHRLAGYDYLIGDADVIPVAEEQFYSERFCV